MALEACDGVCENFTAYDINKNASKTCTGWNATDFFLQFTPFAIWRGCKGHSSSIATTHNFEENFFTEEPCFIPLDV